MRWEQDDPFRLGVWKTPVAAGQGAGGRPYDIAPGDPDASIFVYRIESDEPGIRMRNLARNLVDHDGVSVVR